MPGVLGGNKKDREKDSVDQLYSPLSPGGVLGKRQGKEFIQSRQAMESDDSAFASSYVPEQSRPQPKVFPLEGHPSEMTGINPKQRAEQRREKAGEFFEGNAAGEFIRDYALEPIGEGLDYLKYDTAPGRFLTRLAGAAGGLSGLRSADEGITTGSKAADITADVAGTVGGVFVNPTNLSQGLVGAAYNNPLTQRVAALVGSKISSNLGSKVATEATREAIAGGVFGAANSLIRGETQAKDVAKNAAIDAGLGAGAGAFGPVLSKGIKTLADKTGVSDKISEAWSGFVNKSEKQKNRVIAHPTGRHELNITQEAIKPYMPKTDIPLLPPARSEVMKRVNVLPKGDQPIHAKSSTLFDLVNKTKRPLGLPSGNYKATRLKSVNAERMLEDVIEKIRPEINQRMTPPLENPDELARFVRYHLNGAGYDLSLNEVRNVGYEGLRQMGEEIRKRLNVMDVAREAARERGYNLDELLNGKTPSIRDRITRDAQKRSYGIYDAADVNLKRPDVFKREVKAQAAGPRLKYGTASPEPNLAQSPKIQQPSIQNPEKVIDAPRASIREAGERLRKQTAQQPVQSSKGPILEKAKRIETQNNIPAASNVKNERGFISTLKDSPKSSEGFLERLKGAYKPISNEETVAKANTRVSGDIEKAVEFATTGRILTAEKVATAHRLIDEFQKSGQFDRAVDIAERIAEAGTRAGQSIQAFSIYNRLTPEGILVHAGRIVNRVNERVGKLGTESKIDSEVAAKLTDLASTVQTMTGVKGTTDDVMKLLDKAKGGVKLTDDETSVIQKFVSDAKQVIGDIAPRKESKPRPPKHVIDKRVRDNVVSFMEAQEKAARERLKAKGYRAMSGIPIDDFYDWSIIGASKMAKGIVKFADFSEDMVREFGENVRPYVRQVYDKAVEIFEDQATKRKRETLSEIEKITNRALSSKAITEADAGSLKEMAKRIGELSGNAKVEASQELQGLLQALDKSTIGNKLATTQTISQLLNPKTIVRNLGGNEIFYRLERINKFLSTPIDIARSKLTGGERLVTFRTNNQGQYWRNFIVGAKAGWRGVSPEGLTSQYDLRPNTFSAKWNPLTYLEKALGASIQSFDYAAYKRAVNETIGEMATLRAINEGIKGPARKTAIERYIREADENILRIADEYGKYVTMQDNNALSVGLQKFKRGLNLGLDFGLGDLVLKYARTPGALMMRALEYSPAGVLRSAYIFARPLLRNADANPREVMQSLTRAITGTFGLSGMGYFLADVGIITGAADKDRDVRSLQRMAGEGQYRVNWTALKRWVSSGFDPSVAKKREGDTFINYDWAQPIAINLSIGANAQNNVSSGKTITDNLLGTIYSSVEGGLNTIVEQSVLQGIQRAMQTYPNQSVSDKIVDIASDLPSSFTPTALNQVRQLTDNTSRITYDPDKKQEVINKVKNRIPGLASTLPPAYDTLGRKQENYQDGSNSAFNVFLNPSFTSKYKLTPEAKLVVDLIQRTGDKTIAPRVPDKSMTIDGERVNLTAKEYSLLQQKVGEETSERLKRLVPKQGKLSDEKLIKKIQSELNAAGAKARKEIENQRKGVR
jgi:DNA-binding ferritin-like protein